MKKVCLILGALMLFSACSSLDQYINVGANASPKEKFRACALSEAQTKLKNGTLFAQNISTTKDEIVNTCIKKMALESAGIDEEAQIITSNIINSLRNLQ